jgi:RNA polymerase sigma factor (sigma-70 family)
MAAELTIDAMTSEQDLRISEAVEQQRGRLRNFIRSRVADPGDAEDILQDVFYELVAAYRLAKPIEQVGAWLFQVARNRIIDRFRKKKPEAIAPAGGSEGEEPLLLEHVLSSPDDGPDGIFARGVLIEELEDALAELPPEQRQVFIANEIEGRTFAEITAETGTSINTLLSRKRYAVLHLRRRLREIYEEFNQEK